MLDKFQIWAKKNENGEIEIMEPPNPRPPMTVIRRYDFPMKMNISIGSAKDDDSSD